MKRCASFAAIVLTLALMAHAEEGLTGKWQGETPNGASIVLDLTVKGTALTGTLVRDGQSTELSEGKVSKNTFTFKATLNDRAEALSGELDGDRIKLWLDRQGASNAVVLTRVKSK
jgi:hypothetical protein